MCVHKDFGVTGISVHFLMSGFSTLALTPSNCRSSLTSAYRHHETQKRRRYEERVWEIEHGSFTPLVFSATGDGEQILHSRATASVGGAECLVLDLTFPSQMMVSRSQYINFRFARSSQYGGLRGRRSGSDSDRCQLCSGGRLLCVL